MPVLFSATLFLSAALLFFIELMFGAMILPRFGGTPAVWNTCMLFFQAAMLAGYSYAHWVPTKIGVRKHLPIHLGLLLLPALFLPIAVKFNPPGDGNPVLWLLIIIAVSIGVPFFMISTTNPLLSRWFTETGHPSARDPYFLYAASNVGSMLALFLYPLVPMVKVNDGTLGVVAQSQIWSFGYGLLLLMIGACAWAVYKSPLPTEADEKKKKSLAHGNGGGAELIATPPTKLRIAWWVSLAFVPSSLMLGVTTYLSTDLTSWPLIWVITLGIYLLSFILVFSRIPAVVHTIMILSLPVVVLLQTYLMLSDTSQSKQVLIALHLLTLFVVSMVCHGELANNRPDPKFLTGFYLWMSVGGVLGGLFNALVAPMVFKTIAEYPLVMALSCLLLPKLEMDKPGVPGRWREWAVPAVLGMLVAAFVFQGKADVSRAYEASNSATTRLEKAREDSQTTPEILDDLAFDAQQQRKLLYARSLLGIPLALLILAGGYCYMSLAQATSRANFSRFFAICLGVGIAVGSATQLPASLVERKIEVVQQQFEAKEITKMESREQMMELTADMGAYGTLRWWFGLPLAILFLGLLLPQPAPDESAPRAYTLDIAAAGAFCIVILIHLGLLGDWSVSGPSVRWMIGKTQGFLDGMHQYVPALAETLRVPYEAPKYYAMIAILQFGLPILLCYAWVMRPSRFGLGVGAILMASAAYHLYSENLVELRERSFFGTLKLERSEDDDRDLYYNRLVHGTTLHGKQEVLKVGRTFVPKKDAEPLTYYHRTGPLGQVFAMLEEGELDPETHKPIKPAEPRPAALIGLGTGTTASYSKPGQEFVFYEIDAKVKAIAENPKYFSYLSDAKERGAKLDFVMGDARLSLDKPMSDRQGREDGHFRLIVVDAFSSDAIPVHLITHEALQLYVKKLAPDGVIAFHISNRYLDLEPVLATLSKKENLKCLVQHDSKEDRAGKAASTWVILARSEHFQKAFGSLLFDLRDIPKGESLREQIRPLLAQVRPMRQTRPSSDPELVKLERELADLQEEKRINDGKWYWIDDRSYRDEDALLDAELWTDDYQNLLAIFMW